MACASVIKTEVAHADSASTVCFNESMNPKEEQLLRGAKSIHELSLLASNIKNSIIRTFSEKSAHRATLLREVDEAVHDLVSGLPQFSDLDVARAEDEIARAKTEEDFLALIANCESMARHDSRFLVAISNGRVRRDRINRQRKENESRKEALKQSLLVIASENRERNQKRLKEKEESEKEFALLLDEIKPLGFTDSRQVSEYIVKMKLGSKYGRISGILEMQRAGDKWDYNGGISPDVYARLCNELGIVRRDTGALPGVFRSYNELRG